MSKEAAALLRERAEVYSSDAGRLRKVGNTDDATFLETIRDELRLVAKRVDTMADDFEAARVVLHNAAEIYRHLVMDTPEDQEMHQRVVAMLDDAARSFGSRVPGAETEGQQK